MNPVMYGILKMVKCKVKIITFSQIFHDFYIYVSGRLHKMPKFFNGKDADLVYFALLKITSLCTFVANKSHRSTKAVFLHFPIVCLQ